MLRGNTFFLCFHKGIRHAGRQIPSPKIRHRWGRIHRLMRFVLACHNLLARCFVRVFECVCMSVGERLLSIYSRWPSGYRGAGTRSGEFLSRHAWHHSGSADRRRRSQQTDPSPLRHPHRVLNASSAPWTVFAIGSRLLKAVRRALHLSGGWDSCWWSNIKRKWKR